MNADDKLQAVNCWNRFSESLQEIVNKSAADINNALEIQRENETMKDVFDSTAQNEKELNDNLNELIQQNTEEQLMFNPNNPAQLLDSNLAASLPSDLTASLPANLNTNHLARPADALTNLAPPDTNQFMNSNEVSELNLDNFENNLELNDQDLIAENPMNQQIKLISDSQIKLRSTAPTMQKDHLFNFEQFQRENVIRSSANEKAACELNGNDQNILPTAPPLTANSNDSGFLSCNGGLSNNCDDSSTNYSQINQIGQLNGRLASSQMSGERLASAVAQLSTSQLPSSAQLSNLLGNDLLLSDTRNNIRINMKNHSIRSGLILSSFASGMTSNPLSRTQNVQDSPSTPNENHVTSAENDKEDEKKDEKSANKTKSYSCNSCNSKFSTKGNLLVHQRSHTGERPFACEKCASSFSTKGNLKRHIKAHSGQRPYQCSMCSSKFTEKKSLKVHFRRHTGEKPYKCPMCPKAFSQTGVLKTHLTLHNDERKFLCGVCSKRFRQKSQLRLHQLRHEGVKKWNCNNCNSKFLTKGDLKRHTLVHTGERLFRYLNLFLFLWFSF